MSVSGELLCSFELLKPLDSSALKVHIKKGRNMRNSMLNSPVSGLSQSSASSNAHAIDRVRKDNLRKVSRPPLFRYWLRLWEVQSFGLVSSGVVKAGCFLFRVGVSWCIFRSCVHTI